MPGRCRFWLEVCSRSIASLYSVACFQITTATDCASPISSMGANRSALTGNCCAAFTVYCEIATCPKWQTRQCRLIDKNSLLGGLNIRKRTLCVKKKRPQNMEGFMGGGLAGNCLDLILRALSGASAPHERVKLEFLPFLRANLPLG